MKKIILLVLISVFIFSQAGSASEEVARVVAIEGRVDIFRGRSEAAAPIREDEFISVGDSVRTKTGSKAEIVFKDKSILRVAQNSKVTIKDYTLDEKNRRKSATIELSRGKARAIIEKTRDAAEFVIDTPNAKGSVKGSDIIAFYQAGNSGMFVAEGKLSVINFAHPETKIVVPAGNAVLIPMGELPKGPRPYLDVEKRLNEEDTNVPKPIAKTTQVSVIKGVVAKSSGIVSITNKGQAAAHGAGVNDIVGEGDRIETGQNGYIEIRLDNNNALNLKPNTKLLILKLVINPLTGEYENIFEVTIGKIRARIEGLKGNSKFEVKTPTAICGARGTLMYLEITPTMAKAFFEGGNGYINNLISGAQTDIGMGNNGSADNQGNNSNPAPTSNEERDDWTEGWDSGNDTAGYSSGDSGAGSNLGDTSAGGGTDTGNDTGTGGGANNDSIYIPPEPNPNPTPAPIVPSWPIAFGYYSPDEGFVFDIGKMISYLYGEGDVWNSPMPFSMLGNYTDPANNKLWDLGEIMGSRADGASFFGWYVGTKQNGSLKSLLYAFYLRPDGSMGYFKSTDISGDFYPGAGIFAAEGTMTSNFIIQTNLLPAGLASAVESSGTYSGKVSGEGFYGTFRGESFQITGQDSGDIFKEALGGSYTNLPGNEWSAVTGGSIDDDSHGYYIMHISGDGAWSDGAFQGTITGRDIGYSGNGHGWLGEGWDGAIRGVYDEGSWEAVALGYAPAADLAFGGETTHEDGVNYALFGGTGSLWTGSPNILFMGDYSAQEAPTRDLWRFHTLGRTSDNAAIYGMAGGTKLGNVLKGLMCAIYIRPDLNNEGQYLAGYLKSTDISGNIYPDIGDAGMFETDGTISRSEFEYTTAVSTGELLSYMQNDVWNDRNAPIYRDEFSGNVGGDIAGFFYGESISITDQMWSIWRTESSGTYQTEPQGAWHAVFGSSDEESGDTGYSIGHINGPAWSGNEFSGNITGKEIWYSPDHFEISTMGSIAGETMGTYVNGAWSAANFGDTEELPLQFGTKFDGSFGHFDTELQKVDINYDSSFAGILGGTESLWTASPHLTVIGEFSNSANDPLWHNLSDIAGATKDGAALLSSIGGVNVNNMLKSLFYAFYIRPDPANPGQYLTGYIKSTDITGEFYPGIGMFEANGSLTKYLDLPTIYLPGDLHDMGALDEGSVSYGNVSGATFAGNSFTEATRIKDQNWGLWRGECGGTYQSAPSSQWAANISGYGYSSEGSTGLINSYFIGTISGDAWQLNGEINGLVSANGLSEESYIAISGELLGTYADNVWQSLIIGNYTNEDYLSSSGNLTSKIRDLDSDEMSGFNGLIGLRDSIWDDGTANFVSIGSFDSSGLQQFMWLGGHGSFYSGFSDHNYSPTYYYTTYDIGDGVGAFYGFSAGVGGNNNLKGLIYALYIDPSNNAGVIHGKVDGSYLDDVSMYRLDGILTKGVNKAFELGISPEDLHANISRDDLSGLNDHGGFNTDSDAGDIYANQGSGTMLNITGENWGIWNLVTGGTYEGPTSDIWDVYDLTGMTTTTDSDKVGGSWLGGITGTKWSGNELEGRLDAVWIVLSKDGLLSGRKINGDTLGNWIDVDESEGAWQSISSGVWEEVNPNLLIGYGLDSNIIALGAAANVPITVAYSSVMAGSGAGIISATMDTHLYNMAGGGDGIWAAIINGYYSQAPTTDWTLTVANGADNATLTGSAWSGSQWAANVSGTVGGSTITGQAAGTYTGSETGGTFTGAGTGTYSQSGEGEGV